MNEPLQLSGVALFLGAVTLSLGGCASVSHDPTSAAPGLTGFVQLSGQVSYRERIALSPGSHVTASLNNAPAGKEPAVLAADSFPVGARQVPIAFVLGVPAAKLVAGQHYWLETAIATSDGSPGWSLETPLTRTDTGRKIDVGTLWLRRASAIQDLAGTRWLVEDITHGGVIDNSHLTIRFGPDGTVAGRAGCNTYNGHYESTGHTIRFTQMAVTLKACAPAPEQQERRFLDVLNHATRIALAEHGKLVFTTPMGTSVTATPD